MKLFKACRTQWDRVLGAVLVIGGLVAVVLAWVAASGTVFAFEQIPYLLSGGLVGVCLVALGTAIWLSADLRDEWWKLDRLERVVAEATARPVATTTAIVEEPAPRGADRRLRVTEGLS